MGHGDSHVSHLRLFSPGGDGHAAMAAPFQAIDFYSPVEVPGRGSRAAIAAIAEAA